MSGSDLSVLVKDPELLDSVAKDVFPREHLHGEEESADAKRARQFKRSRVKNLLVEAEKKAMEKTKNSFVVDFQELTRKHFGRCPSNILQPNIQMLKGLEEDLLKFRELRSEEPDTLQNKALETSDGSLLWVKTPSKSTKSFETFEELVLGVLPWVTAVEALLQGRHGPVAIEYTARLARLTKDCGLKTAVRYDTLYRQGLRDTVAVMLEEDDKLTRGAAIARALMVNQSADILHQSIQGPSQNPTTTPHHPRNFETKRPPREQNKGIKRQTAGDPSARCQYPKERCWALRNRSCKFTPAQHVSSQDNQKALPAPPAPQSQALAVPKAVQG